MPFDPDKFLKETEPKPTKGFDPDKFLAETAQPQQPLNEAPEASLGLINRARYAIEPLESNRRAFLVEQYGPENVAENKEGETFVKQMGQWRPVNAPGVSQADIADFLGATPEMVGGLSAGAIGTLAGGPAGIPAAVGGAMVGSAARQGLSALLGVPQVAEPQERAVEVGLSGLFAGGGAALGKGLKGGVRKAFPRFRIRHKTKLKAKQIGVTPTKGQLAGGRDLDLEKQLMETPIFGRKIRKQTEQQVKTIKNNLSKQFGDFSDLDADITTTGAFLKDRAGGYVSMLKQSAADKFDEVALKGSGIKYDGRVLRRQFLKDITPLKLFNTRGRPLKYTASNALSLTPDQFERVQRVIKPVIDDMNRADIDANAMNTLRKTISNAVKEAKKDSADVGLIEIQNHFMDLTESMLDKAKGLKDEFKNARSLWAEYLKSKNIFEKSKNGLAIKDLTDEKVLDKIFNSKKSVELFRKLVDDETVKSAGDRYVNNILRKKLGKEGKRTAAGALKAIRDNRHSIRPAIGNKEYTNLIRNLEYLDMIGEPINSSGTFLQELKMKLLRGAALKTRQMGRGALSESVERLPQRMGAGAQMITDPIQREGAFNSRTPGR